MTIEITDQPLQQIERQLRQLLDTHSRITLHLLNPDYAPGTYAGEMIEVSGRHYRYRSLRTWMEFAELLECRMMLPKPIDEHRISLTLYKRENDSFHQKIVTQREEKYGNDSHFARIHKMEEAAFLHYYLQALRNVKVENRREILNLGINRGDEFKVIENMISQETFSQMHLVGIDHSKSALVKARERFSPSHVDLYAHDINDLASLKLPKADLLISIGTLQSPGINYKPFLMDLVQNHLTENAALILGFPNSRWINGEMIYGAKAPNYAMSEMSLLFNDVMFAKKYLQQKKFRVTITGKQYIFLTATKITSAINQN